MKSLIGFLMAMVILIAVEVQAENSFFYARAEVGEKTVENKQYGSSYNIIETDSIPKWSIGSRIIVGNKGFNTLIPYTYYKISDDWQLGAKYAEDSFKNQSAGPTLRFKGKVWKFFTILDSTHFFDINKKGGQNDFWLFTKTTNKNFNFGFEARYYNYLSGGKFWELRPIRIDYKWKNFDFFLMPNFVLKDTKLARRTIMVGVIIPFDVK